MEEPRQSRRRFFGTLILGLAALPLLWRYLSPRTPAVKSALRISRETIPVDGALVFRQARVAVMRTADDFYALNLTCTHLGCIVNVTPTELVCPCHGSTFNRVGEVLSGPASRRLDRLEVRVEGNEVVVFNK